MDILGSDTFVVLPPFTCKGDIIFGKNSDRPNGEVQEIVYFPKTRHKTGERLQCTYIEIDQVKKTYPVLLSKPAWMWGAEMGANSRGLVIGNGALWTFVDDDPHIERLLGMDLLRIALERCSSCEDAVRVISTLLERYGQGGPCCEDDISILYHNSFLIADRKEAWVLETVGRMWAAEKITNGFKNISNCLSIGTNVSAYSKDLMKYAEEHCLWSGKGDFCFKDVFSFGTCPRELEGYNLLTKFTSDNKFDTERMLQILRDKETGICRPYDNPFHTAGSWVSSLSSKGFARPSCHWVTGTPDPSVSLFKPFVFSPEPVLTEMPISPLFKNDPAKIIPRFQFKVDRRHVLYKLHETTRTAYKDFIVEDLQTLEQRLLHETDCILHDVGTDNLEIDICDNLFDDAIENEKFVYSKYLEN